MWIDPRPLANALADRLRCIARWGLLTALLINPAAASGQSGFTPEELRLIETHGPWPPAAIRDPSNRFSGDQRAIDLGKTLFSDPRLSGTGTVSCASCHDPDRAFTDGRATGIGLAELSRNTPTVANTAFLRWFGWDGAADSLWAQTIRPMVSAEEMAGLNAARQLFEQDEELGRAFVDLVSAPLGELTDTDIVVATAKLIAAWQETLVSDRTPFDDFRDALLAGDADGISAYAEAARRGLKIFVGEGRCSLCHFGPTFTNSEFADVGILHFTRDGVDRGRFGGIESVKASPFNLLGRYSDDPTRRSAARTKYLRQRHSSFGEFRVPGLRSVAETAPYMHNGSLPTLEAVIRHYSEPDMERLHTDGESVLRPLDLTDSEADDLLAFLRSLSSQPDAPAK